MSKSVCSFSILEIKTGNRISFTGWSIKFYKIKKSILFHKEDFIVDILRVLHKYLGIPHKKFINFEFIGYVRNFPQVLDIFLMWINLINTYLFSFSCCVMFTCKLGVITYIKIKYTICIFITNYRLIPQILFCTKTLSNTAKDVL